jgi:hypothetical protein
MAQLFRPGADVVLRLILVAVVCTPFLLVGGFYAFARSPYHTGAGETVEQPVPFSHQHHAADLGIDCRYCHTGVETNRVAGLPPTSTCMTCHSPVWTNAALLAPVRESLASGRPIAWVRVNNLPDYVYFDHSVHIAKGVGCVECHGQVDQMALTRQVAPLTMGFCIDCHRNPGPHLRPPAAEFNMGWQRPKTLAGRQTLAQRLMEMNRVHPAGLTDCSTCHR